VLADYNKRHGKAIRSEQLIAPAINVAIGCDLLRLIIASYRNIIRGHHRCEPSLASTPLGRNAGYSKPAWGVSRAPEQLGARHRHQSSPRLSSQARPASTRRLAWSKTSRRYRRGKLARAAFVS
jgi:hypothetical protein